MNIEFKRFLYIWAFIMLSSALFGTKSYLSWTVSLLFIPCLLAEQKIPVWIKKRKQKYCVAVFVCTLLLTPF